MIDIKVELKLIIKKIVTNSNTLSAIRRHYRYRKACKHFKLMKLAYEQSGMSERIQQYRNAHEGDRCFIIGNGPSLTAADLEKIRGEKSFATNRIYLMYDKTEWRPTYFICQDRQLVRSLFDFYSKCKEKVFLGYHALYEYGINLPNVDYFLTDNRDANRLVSRLDFSEDVSSYVIDGGSVTYSAIQMAAYMGFKEIYLLGVDHNFSHTLDKNRRIVKHNDVKEDYFDSRYKDAFKQFEEKGKIYAAPDKELMDLAFEASKKYCDENGIVIKNATRGGKLEIFERVDFDSLWEE